MYRTRSQSTSGSEGAPSAPPAGLGVPGPKTILLLSKTDKMHILDRELDRVGCYRLRAVPTLSRNIVLFKSDMCPITGDANG